MQSSTFNLSSLLEMLFPLSQENSYVARKTTLFHNRMRGTETVAKPILTYVQDIANLSF